MNRQIACFLTTKTPSELKTKEEKKTFFRKLNDQRNIDVIEINESRVHRILHTGSLVSCNSFINLNTKYNKSRALLLAQ